ncbi:MAG: hypothetical protein DRO67_05880 [Candidatus Asgardarchaeum californiense]|nr:MAG: hypothetical protein DRO67_05880 [Candidatus Asgardarchaeum californiense]
MITLCDELLDALSRKYGNDEQLIAATGECGEFIASVQNYRRGKEPLERLMGEAVDVYFMMQQIRSINPTIFDELCLTKVTKVMQRLHEVWEKDLIEKIG